MSSFYPQSPVSKLLTDLKSTQAHENKPEKSSSGGLIKSDQSRSNSANAQIMGARPLNSREGSSQSMSLTNNQFNVGPRQPQNQPQTIPTPHKPYLSEEFSGTTPKYVTGWTPLISKYSNEQLITYSSPNNKILFQLLSAANNNMASSGSLSSTNNQGFSGAATETDYTQGLSLTPFITHNLHASITASGGGLGQYTPFHDKSLNLTDFFIDSPLRQSPLCELETITPSKFRLQSEKKQSVKQLIFENAKNGKRSINQVDTPPRASQKVSVIEKSLKNAGHDLETEDEDENELENIKYGKNQEDRKDEDLEELKFSVKNLLTPSKTTGKSNPKHSKDELTDISNTYETKTPLKSKRSTNPKNFETPAPVPQSSPSTVIMSLATRRDEPSGMDLSNYPHSPTPSKDVSLSTNSKVIDNGNGQVPALGLFSDQINRRKKPINNRAKNKAQMQAGMNKFQIVFTDVHTLMNNKSKKKTNSGDNTNKNGSNSGINSNSGSSGSSVVNEGKNMNSDFINLATVDMNPEAIAGLQAVNKSVNMPIHAPTGMMRSNAMASNPSLKRDKSYDHKDMSMNSGNNSSMNTSHLNMSTEHTSFELSGQLSTPNSKYVLDRMFEKASPDQKNSMAYWNQPNYAMPPPQAKQQIQPQQSQQQSQQLASHPMMMMMSTPQHQNIIQYGAYNDMLPSEFHSDGNLSAFGYALPGSYAKEIKDKK